MESSGEWSVMELMQTIWVHGSAWMKCKKYSQNGKFQTLPNSSTTRDLTNQQEEISKKIRRRERRATTHLETSLIRTFRVGEEEVEVEDPEEEATNLNIEVGEDLHIMKEIDPSMVQKIEGRGSIESGMRTRLQDLAPANPMKKECGKITKKRWDIAKRGRTGTPKVIIPKSMKTERGLEVPVPEGRDPTEGT